MSLRLLFAALPLAALVACTGGPAPVPPPVVVTVAVPSATAEAAPPPAATATAAAAPSAVPAAEPPSQDTHHAVDLVLRAGDPPCRVVFDAGIFSEEKDSFVAAGVSRISTEASGGCAAGVVFDANSEKKNAKPGEDDSDGLAGGAFLKPNHPKPPDYDTAEWNTFSDFNFDGYADVCAVVMTGAYNYSQKCWLFDPAKRTFAREPALDELIFMSLHPTSKTISAGHRSGGPYYFNAEYAWIKGKLVTTRTETTILGEGPHGKPLPNGFDHWSVRHERRGGKLVKVFDGPERSKP